MSRKLKFLLILTSVLLLAASFAACTFTVPGKAKYILTVESTAGGYIIGGNGEYFAEDSVIVQANNESGYFFKGWYDGKTFLSSEKSFIFIMPNDDFIITARFERIANDLTLIKSGKGVILGGGIYLSDTIAHLNAAPDAHWDFDGWYLDNELLSSDPDFNYLMPEYAVTIEGRFCKTEYELQLTVIPTAGGTATGEGVYVYGDIAVLSASPSNHWRFVGWFEDNDLLSDKLVYEYLVEDCAAIEARFTEVDYEVVINVTGSGLVSGDGNDYHYGNSAVLSASPAEHWRFLGWFINGVLISQNTVYSYIVTGNVEIEARFTEIKYTVTVNVTGNGAAVTGAGEYVFGAIAILTAGEPGVHWEFNGWYLEEVFLSGEVEFEYIVPGEVILEARYVEILYEVNVTIHGNGTVDGDGAYVYGTVITLIALPGEGKIFVYWQNQQDGATCLTTEYSIIVYENNEYALFLSNEDYHEGTGTASDPYIIFAKEHLYHLSNQTNTGHNYTLNNYFALGRDIDLAGAEWTPIGYIYTSTSTNYTRAFLGSFDGCGFAISNFVINESYLINLDNPYSRYYAGLFGYVYSAHFSNLTVIDFEIDIDFTSLGNNIYAFAGGIAGYMSATAAVKASMSNCNAAGKVYIISGYPSGGGIAGVMQYTDASNCGSEVEVIVVANYSGEAGGFSGNFMGAAMNECFALGNVALTAYANSIIGGGGLIGTASNANIFYCYAAGSVNVTNTRAGAAGGGLIGVINSSGSVSHCYATGDISVYSTGTSATSGSAGGLVGNADRISITYCYAEGNVWGEGAYATAGGLIASAKGTTEAFSDCYALGEVTAVSTATNTSSNLDYQAFAGGVAGYTQLDIVRCFAAGNVNITSEKRSAYAGGILGYRSGGRTVSYCISFAQSITITTNGTTANAGFAAQGNFNNCYYVAGLKVLIIKSGIETEVTQSSSYAKTIENINESFFTSTLKFNVSIWSFEAIDIANGNYPVLIF